MTIFSVMGATVMGSSGSQASTKAMAVAAPAATQSLPGPFVSFLFSRTEKTQADNCVANDTNVARLDTEVAPYLNSLGMSGTGSLETGKIAEAADVCTHCSSTMMASWNEATDLQTRYGWSFVSHTATYPLDYNLTPAQSDAETCGSANAIDAHGLHGAHGMIAYPGALPPPTELQTNYGAKCFAWARGRGNNGITSYSDASISPYWQHSTTVQGGACHVSTQPCYNVSMVSGSVRYVLPSEFINDFQGLGPGQWFDLVQFVLVKGKSPTYNKSKVTWDCTSSNPSLHWTNDNERYCYNDWQTIIQAIAATPNITVTDPLTVGIAFGRPATYPTSALSSDTTPPSTPGAFQATPDTSDSAVTLSWNASTDDTGVIGYRLERSTDQSNWTVLSSAITGMSYTDITTASATRYYYRVQALDAAGNASAYATADVLTSTVAAKQYITNSSLEGGSADGWGPYSSTSSVAAVKVTGGSQDGSWALKASNTATSTSSAGLRNKAPNGVSSTVAGTTYTAGAWLSGTAGSTLILQLRECNAAGTSCPDLANVSVKMPASGWVQAVVPYKATANGNQLRFSVYGTLPGKGSFLADSFSLTSPDRYG
jgi:hypothetical protein